MRALTILLGAATVLVGCGAKEEAELQARPVALEVDVIPTERPGITFTRVQDARGYPVRQPTVPAVRPAD